MYISIVVCTLNRAEKLRKTLEAVLASNFPAGATFDVVVVDNGSADNTAEVCQRMEPHFDGRFRVIHEPVLGLSRARNTGVKAAQGEIIAFLDDDIVPQANWLTVIQREFSVDTSLAAISGRVELLNPADLPLTIRLSTERAQFRSVDDAFNLFSGCSMAFRASVLARVGLFDQDLGIGGRFASAEDADFWYRAWRSGEKLVYVPDLIVYHDHGRRSRDAKLKLARGYVLGRAAFYAKYIGKDIAVTRQMYWEMNGALRDWLRGRDQLGWRHLAWLLDGFCGYLALRIRRLLAKSFVGRKLFASPK